MSALAMTIVDINPTQRSVWPRPSRPQPIRRELRGPLEEAWASGTHALPFSPESQTRTSTLADPSKMTWGEIAKTQPGPKSQDGWSRLSPFRPIRTDRHEVPSEHRLASEAGITLLDIDGPVAGADGVTIADVVTDQNLLAVRGNDDEGDGFTGPAPYVVQDPRERERIEWEQMATKAGPLARIRRKHNGHADFVVIDRDGDTLIDGKRVSLARVRIELVNGEQAYVFEPPKPYVYSQVRAAYIRRIIRATGHFPTWDDQAAMAENGRLEQQARAAEGRPFLPLADRPGSTDQLAAPIDHAPFEDHDGPEDEQVLVDIAYELGYGAHVDLDRLLPEELQELIDTWWSRLTPAQQTAHTVRHLRGHRSWADALASQPHMGEYLASDEEIFA